MIVSATEEIFEPKPILDADHERATGCEFAVGFPQKLLLAFLRLDVGLIRPSPFQHADHADRVERRGKLHIHIIGFEEN